MEKLKPASRRGRFGLRVFFFNGILLLSIIAPSLIIRNMDYKGLVDRISSHTALFDYCADRLGRLKKLDWPAAIETFPRLFYQQRICVFDLDRELSYDSGVMKAFDGRYNFKLLLPDPYIDWKEQNGHLDPSVYIDFLRGIDTEGFDPGRAHHSTRSLRYDAGLDRILLSGKLLYSADGEGLLFTMSQSLVDILVHERSVKERFLIIYSLVIALGILSTIVLSRSVTGPLKKLYQYSKGTLTPGWEESGLAELPRKGEIGEICRALQGLIEQQKNQSENFMRFSSDIVHELKTPLAAIRSGLEVYSECGDEAEKEGVYDRTNKTIQRMENLMNEIQFLGSVESSLAKERCEDIRAVYEEVLHELKEAEIEFRIAPGVEGCILPISGEKLYQVLANLLKNALSFSPDRGSVSLSLYLEGRILVIEVGDEGPGIPAEAFPQITRRFFTYRPKGGEKHSGLGLSIVAAILRGCGGNLTYRNKVEGGAEFSCRIPSCGAP
jgi:signal transduction histidine kinase